jgi:NADP-dependent 3-hydroxy acid dehydrogenase YdfG
LASIADLKEKYGANVLTLALDVTKPEQVKTAVAQAYAHSEGSISFSITPAIGYVPHMLSG